VFPLLNFKHIRVSLSLLVSLAFPTFLDGVKLEEWQPPLLPRFRAAQSPRWALQGRPVLLEGMSRQEDSIIVSGGWPPSAACPVRMLHQRPWHVLCRHPHVKAKNSYVDETLFGSVRACGSTKSSGSASPTRGGMRSGSISGSPRCAVGKAAGSPGKAGNVLLTRSQLDRMLEVGCLCKHVATWQTPYAFALAIRCTGALAMFPPAEVPRPHPS
jgi:hypothetical protein